jgi:EcsC protein family
VKPPSDEAKARERGQRLLGAVERLIADDGVLRDLADECAARARSRSPVAAEVPDTRRELAAREIVRTFSNRAALVGALSGLPALLPGLGLLAVGLTGTLAEVAFLLKLEVEMCLALAHVHGFDIRDRRERQLAFLLASVGTQEAAGRSVVADLVRAEQLAIWNYGPRVVGRMILEGFAVLALGSFWKRLFKAVPVLGAAAGSGLNKVLTTRVGRRAMVELRARREQRAPEPTPAAVRRRRRRPRSL